MKDDTVVIFYYHYTFLQSNYCFALSLVAMPSNLPFLTDIKSSHACLWIVELVTAGPKHEI